MWLASALIKAREFTVYTMTGAIRTEGGIAGSPCIGCGMAVGAGIVKRIMVKVDPAWI